MIFVDKGLNDAWVRPEWVAEQGDGRYEVTLREPLGQAWERQIVRYALPGAAGAPVRVTWNGQAVPWQWDGDKLALRVEGLAAGEERVYEVTLGGDAATSASGVTVTETEAGVELSNGVLAVRLPRSAQGPVASPLPGPVLAVRRGDGAWIGAGRLETWAECTGICTRVTAAGALWTEVEVAYQFAAEEAEYRVALRMQPGQEWVEVREQSDLPVRLWPQARPWREIGSLGGSHWAQGVENIAKPCLRPWPTSNFLFDLRAGWAPERLITHSTASWEIMDLPLQAPALKTYTAMRPANPFIDGGWLGVYASGDCLVGVASLDIAHWGVPDETLHPAHRTAGAVEEVLLLDGAEAGTFFKFPVEKARRRWLLAVMPAEVTEGLRPMEEAQLPPGAPPSRVAQASKPAPSGETQGTQAWKPALPGKGGEARRLAPDPGFALWQLRIRQSDLPLDKVKDWVLDWPETGVTHPRVLCDAGELPALREKVQAVPELRATYEETRQYRSADRYLMEGEVTGLTAIEAATHAGAIVQGILEKGYTSPSYCIALARPLRRYALGCDMQWDSFTAEEKREARRVLALAAYILSDGDWWQYALTPGGTTYLPNFNTDVWTCAGLIGICLGDHPNTDTWIKFLTDRMEIELEHHLRLDGGGDENVGNYLPATWWMLYLPVLWAMRLRGIKDYSDDPRVRAGGRFLLKVLGPPDPRDGGRRQMPPIGHHPGARKAYFMYAAVGTFLKDSDPSLAANLMWAWREMGSPVASGYDHSGITALAFTPQYVMLDPAIPAVAPRMESHDLPYIGAVLRSHDRSGQGSFLMLKAGRVHSHHEDDEGSIHYFGRGVPLAADGLPLMNLQVAEIHNVVSFGKYGQPTAIVEQFTETPGADYLRARVNPRAFAVEGNYFDNTHRSGFTREIVFVKAPVPGGVEYVVLRDVCTGPDPAQWNLDVLSREPSRVAPGRLRFPGHPELGMGLDLILLEPAGAEIKVEAGRVYEKLLTPEGRAQLLVGEIDWTVTEHWLTHVPGGPGATFLALLFPRRAEEPAPEVDYLAREETLRVRHAEGEDIVFLRPNPWLGISLDGVFFQGRAGIARRDAGAWELYGLDAERMEGADGAGRIVYI